MFKKSLRYANSHDHGFKPHNELAFTNYLRWFVRSTRLEMYPPAFEPDILDQPNDYYGLAREQYNKAVREGTQTAFAPVLTFVVSIVCVNLFCQYNCMSYPIC